MLATSYAASQAARRTAPAFRQRAWASLTGPVLAKEDPGTDIQEDSTANKSALEDSKKKAEGAEGVTRGKQGGDSDVMADPEVDEEAKKGSKFPHQTREDRQANMASSTQGESPVKTREYTPKPGSKLYSDEKGE